MSKPRTVAKPCTLRVTAVTMHGHINSVDTVTDQSGKPRIYRSVREARRRILDTRRHFNTLATGATFEVEIVPLNGKPIRVNDSTTDYIWQEAEWHRRDTCIGAMWDRGETPII